jgi:probable F420-dependent oxidoreductase
MTHRPFRFGVLASMASSRAEWLAKVRRIEAQGYDTVLLPDHLDGQLGPVAALGAAAAVTETIRIGSLVFNADLRHPALLAKEAATLDLLSGGRFELGLGAGWDRAEYDQAGLPFAAAAIRVERLREAVAVTRGLLGGEPVSLAGSHYPARGLEGFPRPAQQRLPIMIGGGGPRVLRLAGAQADIAGISPRFLPAGVPDVRSMTSQATRQRVDLVRLAAAPRADEPELNLLVEEVSVTTREFRAADEIGTRRGLGREEVLSSPYFLIGSPPRIARTLRRRRAEYGFSYVVVFEAFADIFAGVPGILAGA